MGVPGSLVSESVAISSILAVGTTIDYSWIPKCARASRVSRSRCMHTIMVILIVAQYLPSGAQKAG